ncbi:MAG: hypothetical protein ABI120_11775 [Gemmatimonadaceae bacterium]
MADVDVVRAWEMGQRASPIRRALTLLSESHAADTLEAALLDLTPGERDTRLFALRRATFGDAMDCVATCPACSEHLEFVLDAAELAPSGSGYAADSRPAVLTIAGYQGTVRPPTLRLLEQLSEHGERTLLQECVRDIGREGAPVEAMDLPAVFIAAVDAHLAAADPAAITEIAMRCPACEHTWSQLFDIVGYLWAEVAARADRLFSEVHVLASAYGWSEETILTMSQIRRERYLDMVVA